MISRAWQCLLLWRISILGGAFEQERARKENKEREMREGWGGRVFQRFRSHTIL